MSSTTLTPTSLFPPPSELPSIIIIRAGLPDEDEQKPLVFIKPPSKREPLIYLPPVISISPPSALVNLRNALLPIFVVNSKPVAVPDPIEPAKEVPNASGLTLVIKISAPFCPSILKKG